MSPGGVERERAGRGYLRILSYLRPYSRQIVLVLLFNLLFIVFNTASIWLVAPFVQTLFRSPSAVSPGQAEAARQGGGGLLDLNGWLKGVTAEWIGTADRFEALRILCVLIFLAFLLKNLFAFCEMYVISYVEQRAIRDLRDQVYERLLWQPVSFFQRHPTGNLISRLTNDVSALNVALNRSFTKVIRDPVVILVFLALLLSISWRLTLLALVVIPASGILIHRIGQSLKRKSLRVQERIADLTTILQETITGVRIIKAFSMERREADRFRGQTARHFQAVLNQVRMNRLASPLSETLGVGIMVCVLWFGGQLVLRGELIDSEDFIRFVVILFSIMAPIKSLGELNNNAQIALAAGRRVFELLDAPAQIGDPPGAKEKKSFDHAIRYEDVTFLYPGSDAPALSGIDLTIPRDQRIALVGSSGAGKSTLVSLLPRFYEATRGRIWIDEDEIRSLRLDDLRRLMGLVTQDVVLFDDTVAQNIAYGSPGARREEIERAARLAHAEEFILALPDGYETRIAERGMRLSGGQRQRISIARAVLRDPPILILDEATSSLDSESERLIQEAIESLMRGRTVVIIAHRLSSIVGADSIVLMEGGRILDRGTHPELLARSERYRQLHRLQEVVGARRVEADPPA